MNSLGLSNGQISNIVASNYAANKSSVGVGNIPFMATNAVEECPIPKETRCPNENCPRHYDTRKPIDTKFCDACGNEMQTVNAELYVVLSTTPNIICNDEDGSAYPQTGKTAKFDCDKTTDSRVHYVNTVSVKQLIHIIKEYEKEMFIEGI